MFIHVHTYMSIYTYMHGYLYLKVSLSYVCVCIYNLFYTSNRYPKSPQLKQQLWLRDPPAQSSLPFSVPLEDHNTFPMSLLSQPLQKRAKAKHAGGRPAMSYLWNFKPTLGIKLLPFYTERVPGFLHWVSFPGNEMDTEGRKSTDVSDLL